MDITKHQQQETNTDFENILFAFARHIVTPLKMFMDAHHVTSYNRLNITCLLLAKHRRLYYSLSRMKLQQVKNFLSYLE